MTKQKILYIHGFNSSPGSAKAILFKEYIAMQCPNVDVVIPQVKTNPNDAISQLIDILETEPDVNWHFVGSSLGGYLSTYLAEKFKRPAVLVNPAVKPFELLADYIGEQLNPYTNEVYTVTEQHMHQLKLLEINEPLTKHLYYLMVQTGDEVLDFFQAVKKYRGCKQEVQEGGDHSFVNFEDMLPDIVKFLQIA